MKTKEIHRATLLDTINRFITSLGKAPLTPIDLDIVIILIRDGVNNSGFVKAVKHIRTVTITSVPVTWATDFEYSSGNALCKYINEYSLHNTGTITEWRGLGLKDAVDICRFIKANIDLLTD